MSGKVIFKSIGQGDSIILESKNGGEHRIGIIDCRLNNGVNEIEKYLSGLDNYKIEFILISHAHADHYDGMMGLFEYLRKKDKTILCLYHTHWLSKAFGDVFRSTPLPESMVNDLGRLLSGIEQFKKLGVIRQEREMVDGSVIFFNNRSINVMGISPSLFEKNLFVRYLSRVAKKDHNGEMKVPKTNLHANLFSSVCCISLSDSKNYILLCADAERITFKRLGQLIDEEPFNENYDTVIATQIPHHGSHKNFHKLFWEKIKMRSPFAQAVISVGENTYNHPSIEVLRHLADLKYTVKITDKLSEAYFEKLDYIAENTALSDELDWVSSIIDDRKDVEFLLN